jgi:sortase A
MPGHRRQSSGERAARSLRWLERLFLIAGAAALIWCAVIVTEGAIAQRNARSAFEIANAVAELTDAAAAQKADVPPSPPTIDRGSAIAALSIPRVRLSAIVLHGSDARTLQRGPGHLEHTAVPGGAGNVVIAGHRDSFFRPLRRIRVGDDIFLDTRDGRFHYRVISLRVVGPREVSVLAATSEEVLTLITCYPFLVLGPAPDRFIVRAARVADHPATTITAVSQPPLDRTAAPSLETVSARAPIAIPTVPVKDDERLVRGAVRRYLHAVGLPDASCAVTLDGDGATVDCDAPAHSPAQGQTGRTFVLERSGGAWAIRAIELRRRE